MGKVLTDAQYYTDIASAIREKAGSTTTFKPSEMAEAIKELPIIDDSNGGNWVKIGEQLQRPMYLLGDADMSGGTKLDADDVSAISTIYNYGADDALAEALADMNMDGVVNNLDITAAKWAVQSSSVSDIITYCTVFKYTYAEVNDFVSVYLADSDGHIYSTYAYVRKEGVIVVYSNEKIPTSATGEIKILKGDVESLTDLDEVTY